MSRSTYVAKYYVKKSENTNPNIFNNKAVTYISTSCQYKNLDWPSTMESGLKKSNELKPIKDLVILGKYL